MATSLTHVKGDVKANTIFDLTFDACQKCRKSNFSSRELVLWEPTHGHRGRGRPNTTYIDTLKRDTGAFEASEIAALIADKRLWKDLVVARLRATK